MNTEKLNNLSESNFIKVNKAYNQEFGYMPLLVNKSKSIEEIENILNKCIQSKDDSAYIGLLLKDYEKYYHTRYSIEKVKGQEGRILKLVDLSFTYNIDILALYDKGVTMDTIINILSDINTNKNLQK